MNVKGALFMGLLLFLAIFVGGAGIMALTERNLSSSLHTGGIDISLESLIKKDGKEQVFNKPQRIVPGQRVPMIPRLFNKAETCYVRVRIDFQMDRGIDRPVRQEDCYGLDENWVMRNGYLYLVHPLRQGEQVDLYQGIKIPEDWSEKNTSGFRVDIAVEAIQAAYLEPDFRRQSPWGAVETETSQISEGYRLSASRPAPEKGIDLVYEGGIKALTVDSEQFLSGFEKLMPGGTYSDTLKLKNTAKEKIRILFKRTCADSRLLKEMRLTIRTDSGVFFEGPLDSGALSEYQTLTEIEESQRQEVFFEVYMPKELQNDYQEMKDQMTWWFMVSDMEGRPVKTGDTRPTGVWVGLLILSIAVLAGFLGRKRRT